MEFLSNIISSFNTLLWSYVLIALLIFIGLFFTFKSNFVQFKFIKDMFLLLAESAEDTISSTKDKKISSFQAFCISTASRVGTGNMAGIAIAISLGGPGAIFWMWLIALIGSASSFVESTLAQVYKIKDGDSFRGGPSYYIEKGLNKRWLGIAFSILITVCFGLVFNSVQANTITLAFEEAFKIDRLLCGLIISGFAGLIIFGGVNRIAKVSSIIVPIMATLYVVVSLFVVIKNIDQIPAVLSLIFSNAFGIEAGIGGGIGAAIMMGIKRGLFSNEAGMGSAPNAAATAHTTHPAKQGLIQTLGVFTDTLLICSCTAFIILLSGHYGDTTLEGIKLTQISLASQVGSWGNIFIALCILLFAFSSIIGNYYYGETNIEFITPNKIWLFIYRIFVVGMVLFGSIAKVQIVWDMADLFMGFMALINLVAIFKLRKIAFIALKDYSEQRKAGKNPIFSSDILDNIDGIDCWDKNKKEGIA